MCSCSVPSPPRALDASTKRVRAVPDTTALWQALRDLRRGCPRALACSAARVHLSGCGNRSKYAGGSRHDNTRVAKLARSSQSLAAALAVGSTAYYRTRRCRRGTAMAAHTVLLAATLALMSPLDMAQARGQVPGAAHARPFAGGADPTAAAGRGSGNASTLARESYPDAPTTATPGRRPRRQAVWDCSAHHHSQALGRGRGGRPVHDRQRGWGGRLCDGQVRGRPGREADHCSRRRWKHAQLRKPWHTPSSARRRRRPKRRPRQGLLGQRRRRREQPHPVQRKVMRGRGERRRRRRGRRAAVRL